MAPRQPTCLLPATCPESGPSRALRTGPTDCGGGGGPQKSSQEPPRRKRLACFLAQLCTTEASPVRSPAVATATAFHLHQHFLHGPSLCPGQSERRLVGARESLLQPDGAPARPAAACPTRGAVLQHHRGTCCRLQSALLGCPGPTPAPPAASASAGPQRQGSTGGGGGAKATERERENWEASPAGVFGVAAPAAPLSLPPAPGVSRRSERGGDAGGGAAGAAEWPRPGTGGRGGSAAGTPGGARRQAPPLLVPARLPRSLPPRSISQGVLSLCTAEDGDRLKANGLEGRGKDGEAEPAARRAEQERPRREPPQAPAERPVRGVRAGAQWRGEAAGNRERARQEGSERARPARRG